jgi:conjugative transfer signal peptidase TraF
VVSDHGKALRMFDVQISSFVPRGRVGRTGRTAPALLLFGLAALTVICLVSTKPVLLLNRTPSEPPGFYILTARAPARGDVIAFKTPAPAFPYADEGMDYLHHRPLLKAVAADAGDQVCTTAGELVVNGVARAPIAAVDHRNRALPHWVGCRRLNAGELFVFSARVPNSFDSRYYGPVRLGDVLGVYELVAPIAPEAG